MIADSVLMFVVLMFVVACLVQKPAPSVRNQTDADASRTPLPLGPKASRT